jgi:tetratricopeptide (TPR) repeat protein
MAIENLDLGQQQLEPYIGPRPFRTDIKDQLRFFGRNTETNEIIALITSHRIILVYAQSGVGKTSIFNAKIIPSLRDYGFEVLPIARVKITSTISPNDSNNNIFSKIKNLYIYNAFQTLIPEIDPSSILDLSLFEFLDRYFPTHKDKNGEIIKQVLIFDQLEELFSFYPDGWLEQQINFFKQIADSLENNPFLRIVFVIREDFLGQLDPFRHILPEKLRPHFRLEALRGKQAILAIKGPLTNIIKNLTKDEIENIESEIKVLVNDLLKIYVELPGGGDIRQLEGEFIEPIQLQVVCKRWWSERNKSQKPILEDVGNVNKALEEFYEDAVISTSKQTGVREREIRLWCEKQLTTSSGTRALIHRGQNDTAGIHNKVVDSLESKYLIRREWRSGASWYELTHDRLIKPIKDSNKKWFDKQQKSKRSFRIKLFLPIILISIIGISSLLLMYQTNIVQQNQEIQGLVQQKNVAQNFLKGLSLYQEGKYSEAVDSFNQVLQIEPNYTKAHFLKGSSLYQEGKYSEAVDSFNQVLQIEPNYVKTQFREASSLYKAGNYNNAHESFKQLLQIDSNNTDVLYYDGLSLYNLERYIEAIAMFNRALALEPTNTNVLLYKGLSLYNLERYNEAIAMFNRALALEPTNTNVLLYKGLSLYNLERYNEAIAYYDIVLEIEPNNINATKEKEKAQSKIMNFQPKAMDKSVSTSFNSPIYIFLEASDENVEDELTAIIVTNPLHGTLSEIDQSTGTVTYTPNKDFEGTDTFTYIVNDGTADSNNAVVTVTVNGLPNFPPKTVDESVTTSFNSPIDISLEASDENGDKLTPSIVSDPTSGALSKIDPNTNTVTYTPNKDFEGTDTFTYKVNDGTDDSNNAVVTVIVTGAPNAPPIIKDKFLRYID